MNGLPFEDRADFEDAGRGLIGSLDPGVVKEASGRVVWDNDAFAFLQGDCPETANPSLWRQSRLCARQGGPAVDAPDASRPGVALDARARIRAARPARPGLLLTGVAYGGLQNLTLAQAFTAAGEPARSSVSIAWNLSFDAGTGLGAFAAGAIATATSYSVAFGVLALAVGLVGGCWALPALARRGH